MDPRQDALPGALESSWGLTAAEVETHDRGMNSRTWIVRDGARRWVAKAVPEDATRRFGAALAVAAIVDAAGIPAGAPEPTIDGRLTVVIDDSELALLSFVDGNPLVGDDPTEQRLIGSTLARVHRAVIGRHVPNTERFHWLDVSAPHLDIEPWVRPAVQEAVAAYEALPPSSLTWGLLHSDPAPEAFLLDPRSGTCGLIDWAALFGPLLYDLASAVMYVGGFDRATALLDAYLAEGPVGRNEADRALEPMLRLRWAVQADYFARRIATNDLTGISGPGENLEGLDDARRALAA
jgi:homoserine kinase type II